MSSFFFTSSACRHCTPAGRNALNARVLRTTTEDICCECGALLQTFPATTATPSTPDLILIPDPVSEALAKLLKLRLFFLDEGTQPQRVGRGAFLHLDKTPSHRIGDQLKITLRGHGNTWAEIRWSYSHAALLHEHPWEREEYISQGNYRKRIELKPKLSDMEFAKPTRIVRAVNALSSFDLTEGFRVADSLTQRLLRLEQRTPVQPSPVPTVEKVLLIVKVQLEWIQVGTRFPDDTGPREFYAQGWKKGPTRNLEESIDWAIHLAMHGKRDYDGTIHLHWKHVDGTGEIGRVSSPTAGKYNYERGDNRCGRENLHTSSVILKARREDYLGPFKDDEGRYLVPAGEHIMIEVRARTKPHNKQDPKLNGYDYEDTQVKVLHGEEVLADVSLVGRQYQFGHPPGFGTACVDFKKDKFEPGETLVTRITDVNGKGLTEEKTYLFVSWNRYRMAWEAYRARFIDEYKVQVCADIQTRMLCYTTGLQPPKYNFEVGCTVAAWVNGRWMEGTYAGAASGETHFVKMIVPMVTTKHNVCTETSYEVARCLPLEEALQSGLEVVAPYDPDAPTGFHAVVRAVPEPLAPASQA